MRALGFKMTMAATCLALALPGCGDDDVAPPGDGGGPRDSGGGPVDAGPPTDGGGGGTDAGPPATDAGPPAPCGDFTLPSLGVVSLGAFSRPIQIISAPGTTDLFVVESRGRIIRISPDGSNERTFLDIQSTIGAAPGGGDERGLLGAAFHPNYDTNGRLFVGYTPLTGGGRNVVAEYARSTTDPDVADNMEVVRLVNQTDPEGNHNGGLVMFGPDGFLYAGMGDGGGGGDGHGTNGNGLNLMTLLGKILRLDVDNAAGMYAAAGNPFAAGGGLPQIWAYGVRNPWRFSFDRMTGDFYMGDVGQGSIEEIDFQPASSTGGENYGWRAYEGNRVFDAASVSLVPDHATPITTYPHSGSGGTITGCSIAGGFVYRGSAIPSLRGIYLFGDFCASEIVALRYCDGMVHGETQVADLDGAAGGALASFGQDNDGELYLVALSGEVSRIVPGP